MVYLVHQFVALGGHYGERVPLLAGAWFRPAIPHAAHCERLSVGELEVVRDFDFAAVFVLELKEPIHQHQQPFLQLAGLLQGRIVAGVQVPAGYLLYIFWATDNAPLE